MSVVYCHDCDRHIDTDYHAEHFCYNCGEACMEYHAGEDDLCKDCEKAQQDELATQQEYRETQG